MLNRVLHKIVNAIRYKSEQYLYSSYRKKYDIHPTFKFGGLGNVIYGDGSLHIGEYSYANQVWIQLAADAKVTIGKNCRIAHNVRIYTQSVDPDQDLNFDPWNAEIKSKSKLGSVSIGNGVWIGANVFINPGITIGDNAVVGANSVVTSNIPPFAIYGGVPAKLIRYKNLNPGLNEI
jgi:maltose O-acetyltransferase